MILKGRITYAHFPLIFVIQITLIFYRTCLFFIPLSVDRNVQLTSLIQREDTLVQQVKFERTRLVALRSCQQRMLPNNIRAFGRQCFRGCDTCPAKQNNGNGTSKHTPKAKNNASAKSR